MVNNRPILPKFFTEEMEKIAKEEGLNLRQPDDRKAVFYMMRKYSIAGRSKFKGDKDFKLFR